MSRINIVIGGHCPEWWWNFAEYAIGTPCDFHQVNETFYDRLNEVLKTRNLTVNWAEGILSGDEIDLSMLLLEFS